MIDTTYLPSINETWSLISGILHQPPRCGGFVNVLNATSSVEPVEPLSERVRTRPREHEYSETVYEFTLQSLLRQVRYYSHGNTGRLLDKRDHYQRTRYHIWYNTMVVCGVLPNDSRTYRTG